MSQHRDPQTPDEWRRAVIFAEVLLRVDSARKYGLVDGGPSIDVDRCEQIIWRGRKDHGIEATSEEIDAGIDAFARAAA